jgi:hypothetical protein
MGVERERYLDIARLCWGDGEARIVRIAFTPHLKWSVTFPETSSFNRRIQNLVLSWLPIAQLLLF